MSRLQCSQLHFCPKWNVEDQENQGKINATLKKMHATSGHIVYLYICNCSLDMHNTWDEWLQQKIASSKFTVSCISLLFITSHRSMMFALKKKRWILRNAKCYVSYYQFSKFRAFVLVSGIINEEYRTWSCSVFLTVAVTSTKRKVMF